MFSFLLDFPEEEGEGGLNDGVLALLPIHLGHADEAVRCDAKLGVPSLLVEEGRGGETYAPAVGQLGGEGKPAPATGAVTEGGDLRQDAHPLCEVVRRAVAMPVGEESDRA